MNNILEYMAHQAELNPDLLARLVTSVLVVFILWLLRLVVLRVVGRQTQDVRIRYGWRKSTTYVTVILGIIVLGRIWITGFGSVTTYFGLLSAGIAIALKDPLVNLAGWLFIIWRRPFTVGDRIEVGGYRGDVIDLRIFQFTLMEIGNWVDADQSTGRVIRIPNGKVFTEMLANYSKGFSYIWNEIPVLITFESNWRKAKGILEELGSKHAEHLSSEAMRQVKEAADQVMIFYRKLTPAVYTSVRDSGVLLTIRYLCEPRGRRGSEQAIWEDILDRFAENADIDLAYPTQRFYDAQAEARTPAGIAPGTPPPTPPR